MAARATPRTSTQTITGAERRRQALELRKAGYTFEAIAQHLGYYDRSYATRDVMKGIRQITAEPAEELRTLMIEQHRTMLKAIWPEVVRGNLPAIDRAIRILAAVAELQGLTTPASINIDVIVTTAAAELGLTPDESSALHNDMRTWLATQKAGVG